MILFNGRILNEALTVEPVAGDAAEAALFKRFCPAKYDETSPEYKKRQELLKADPNAKVPAKSYKYGDTVIKWYRAAKARNDAEQLDELTTNIQSVEDLFVSYEQAVSELKREGKMPETVDVNGRNVPAGDPAKFRMLSGFKAVLSELKNLSVANKKFLDPMEPNDLDRKNIRLCFVEDGIAVWKTRYFKTTNKFVHQMWDRTAEQMAKDNYGNPDVDSPYCTRMTENWKTYSNGDPEYSQFWFFKVVPGVDYVPGDLNNPGTYETFKKLFKTGPNILMLAGSNGDLDDRRSNDFYDIEEIANDDNGMDFGGKRQKLYNLFIKYFSVEAVNESPKQWWENDAEYEYRKEFKHLSWNKDTDKKSGIDKDTWYGNMVIGSDGLYKIGTPGHELPKKLIGGIILNNVVIDKDSPPIRYDLIPKTNMLLFRYCEIYKELNFNLEKNALYDFSGCTLGPDVRLSSVDGELDFIYFKKSKAQGNFVISRNNILSNIKKVKKIYIQCDADDEFKVDPTGIDIDSATIRTLGALGGDLSRLSFKNLDIYGNTGDGIDSYIRELGFPHVIKSLTLNISGCEFSHRISTAINSTDKNCDITMRYEADGCYSFLEFCEYRNIDFVSDRGESDIIGDVIISLYKKHESFDDFGQFHLKDENAKFVYGFVEYKDRTFRITLDHDTKKYLYYIAFEDGIKILNKDGTPFDGADAEIKCLETEFNTFRCGSGIVSKFIESGILGRFTGLCELMMQIYGSADGEEHGQEGSVEIKNINIKDLYIKSDLELMFQNCECEKLNIDSKYADKRSYYFQKCDIGKLFIPGSANEGSIYISDCRATVYEYNYNDPIYKFYIKNSQIKTAFGRVNPSHQIFKNIENSVVETTGYDNFDKFVVPIHKININIGQTNIIRSTVKAHDINFIQPTDQKGGSGAVSNAKFECESVVLKIDGSFGGPSASELKYVEQAFAGLPDKFATINFEGYCANQTRYIRPGTHIKALTYCIHGDDAEGSKIYLQDGVKIDTILINSYNDPDIKKIFADFKYYDIPLFFTEKHLAGNHRDMFELHNGEWYRRRPAINECTLREWMRVLGKIR